MPINALKMNLPSIYMILCVRAKAYFLALDRNY